MFENRLIWGGGLTRGQGLQNKYVSLLFRRLVSFLSVSRMLDVKVNSGRVFRHFAARWHVLH